MSVLFDACSMFISAYFCKQHVNCSPVHVSMLPNQYLILTRIQEDQFFVGLCIKHNKSREFCIGRCTLTV